MTETRSREAVPAQRTREEQVSVSKPPVPRPAVVLQPPKSPAEPRVQIGKNGVLTIEGRSVGSPALADRGRPKHSHGPAPQASMAVSARAQFSQRLHGGAYQQVTGGATGQRLHLERQYALFERGDVARQLQLAQHLQNRGGWRHRHVGWVQPEYRARCVGLWYAGPASFSSYCWYPRWNTWVDWCWWDRCAAAYDPRPVVCQPVVCRPATSWSVSVQGTAAWQPLPGATCGTWVDVPAVSVAPLVDLELLAVRFVDPGHPQQNTGPRYRLWFRNNGCQAIERGFTVVVGGSDQPLWTQTAPQTAVRVEGCPAGAMQAVDVRLPAEASTWCRTSDGVPVPFRSLHVVLDAGRELLEFNHRNNGAVLAREQILPVDPVAFAAQSDAGDWGSVVNIAGEGLGPEPGLVVVHTGGREYQAEILGWFDLGVQIRLPAEAVQSGQSAEVIVVRGDGAAANPLRLAGEGARGEGLVYEAGGGRWE